MCPLLLEKDFRRVAKHKRLKLKGPLLFQPPPQKVSNLGILFFLSFSIGLITLVLQRRKKIL
jgi:hypothetical protein